MSDVLSESKNNESSDGDSFESCIGNESMPSIEDTCMAGEGGPDVTGSDSSEVLTRSNGVSKSGDTNIIDGSISILEDCSENGNFSNTEDTAKRDGVTKYDDMHDFLEVRSGCSCEIKVKLSFPRPCLPLKCFSFYNELHIR